MKIEDNLKFKLAFTEKLFQVQQSQFQDIDYDLYVFNMNVDEIKYLKENLN